MLVVRFGSEDLEGMEGSFGVVEIWILASPDGEIVRELGFDQNGHAVHRYPGSGEFGRYGIFDGNVLDPVSASNSTAERFDHAWQSGDNHALGDRREDGMA